MKTDLNILYIDDDPFTNDLMKFSLEMQGHVVSTSFAINDVDTIMQQQEFDLFILDINLKSGDGLDICRTIRQRNQHKPIIIYTPEVNDDERHTGYEAGATMYIAKPNSFEVILSVANVMRNAKVSKRSAATSN